eukprot:4509813-Prymnesium_polylepis.1
MLGTGVRATPSPSRGGSDGPEHVGVTSYELRVPTSSEGDANSADRMHMRMDEMPEVAQHMNMHTNEMAEVEPPKSKRQR